MLHLSSSWCLCALTRMRVCQYAPRALYILAAGCVLWRGLQRPGRASGLDEGEGETREMPPPCWTAGIKGLMNSGPGPHPQLATLAAHTTEWPTQTTGHFSCTRIQMNTYKGHNEISGGELKLNELKNETTWNQEESNEINWNLMETNESKWKENTVKQNQLISNETKRKQVNAIENAINRTRMSSK